MIMQMSQFPRVIHFSLPHLLSEWNCSRKGVTHCFTIKTPKSQIPLSEGTHLSMGLPLSLPGRPCCEIQLPHRQAPLPGDH